MSTVFESLIFLDRSGSWNNPESTVEGLVFVVFKNTEVRITDPRLLCIMRLFALNQRKRRAVFTILFLGFSATILRVLVLPSGEGQGILDVSVSSCLPG